MKLEIVWKQVARYQLGELSDIVVRFSESTTCLKLPRTNSKVMDARDPINAQNP